MHGAAGTEISVGRNAILVELHSEDLLNSLADKFKNSRLLYQHCLTVGSVVTSGLYMQRTKALSKTGLEKALSLCREADLKIKSSALDSYDVIEVLLIKLFMTGRLR